MSSKSSRVTVGKTTKETKVAKKKVEVEEEHSDNEEQEVKTKVIKKTTRVVKKKEEPKEEPKEEVQKSESEDEKEKSDDSDNEVAKWEHDETERVASAPVRQSTPPPVKKVFQPRERHETHRETQRDTHRETHRETQRDTHRDTQQDTREQKRSVALNFAYSEYRNVNHSASTLSTPDLLRMLIVRAHDDGQTSLKKCLENTLRAVNLECKFPTLPSLNPRHPGNNPQTKYTPNKNKFAKVDEEE